MFHMRERVTRRSVVATAAAGLMLAVAAGCTTSGRAGASEIAQAAPAPAWHSLFDGTSMDQWRGYRDEDISAWHVADGTMTKAKSTGDLITRRPYHDFELELEWKLSTGGNAGIFYRGTEEYDHVYWSAPEFQLLDDANAPDGKLRITAAGSDYALYPSPAGIVKPAGEWNTMRIVVQGNHVEHWLNGQKMVDYELGSPDWTARVQKSKFAAWPDYGKSSWGYIGIQGDHDGDLSLRDIRIRELP